MDERTRQQLTWIIIITFVASTVIWVVHRRYEDDMLLHTIATQLPSARVAAAARLVEKQKLMEALEDEPRWVQDRTVAAVMMVGTEAAIFQLVAAKSVLDEPVSAVVDAWLTSVGEKAIGPLVLALQDKDAAIRGGAGGPLKTIGAPAVDSLMSLIDVYDDAVRGLVSSTLGGIGEPAVEPLLRVMKQDKPGLEQGPAAFRRSKLAAEAAFKAMGEPALEPVINHLLNDEDPEVRGVAADILGTVAKGLDEEIGRVAVPPLIRKLTRDPAWAVRRRAAAALGMLGDTALHAGAVAPLIAALGDPYGEVRAAAATALGALGDPVAAPALAHLLLTNRLGATAEIAAALEQLGPPALAPLTPALKHPDAEVRLVATRSIATIGTADAVLPLGAALADPDIKVRRAAADALRTLADVRVLQPLIAALGDSDARVYYAARDALARLGAPAIAALIQVFGRADTREAYIAEQALAQIGAPAVPALVQALGSENPSVRQWAATALGDIGAEAIEPVARLLGDSNAPVAARVAAARALGATGNEAATAPLAKAVTSAPPAVRAAAIRALGKVGDPAGTEALVKALADPDMTVRRCAMDTLVPWRVGDVDARLAALLDAADTDAARRAALVLAKHSPGAGGELIRAVGAVEEGSLARADRVRSLLEETVADDSLGRSLRLEAIEGLTYVGDESSLDVLEPLLVTGGGFAKTAAQAVGRIGQRLAREAELAGRAIAVGEPGARAATMLLRIFKTADSDELRLVAGSGLALMGELPVVALIKEMETADAQRRAWIAGVLGAIGEPASDPLLDARGRAEDLELKKWLAAALVVVGDARALDMIRQLPEEEQPDPPKIEAAREVFVRLQKLL